MRKNKVLTYKVSKEIFTILLFIVLVLNIYAYRVESEASQEYITRILDNISFKNIKAHVQYLSSLETRVPGYPGHDEAREYILKQLKSYGLNPVSQPYTLVMMREIEAYIEVGGERFKVYGLWPNGMINPGSTGPEGIEGPLVYVGKGTLEELDGKDIDGSIVLMEFNSEDAWLRVADLGAKAVVYIEPYESNRYEALSKFSIVPVKFTRVYVDKSTGDKLYKLAQQGARAKLVFNAILDKITDYNVFVKIKGTEYPDDAIVIAVHYDSWSIVPSKSPAAVEALSVGYLLELARVLSENRPKRTVYLAFLSGYWEGLAGPRHFVEKLFYMPNVSKGEYRIWFMMGVDLSDESPVVSSLFVGQAFRFITSRIVAKCFPINNKIINYLRSKDVLKRITGRDDARIDEVYHNDMESTTWWDTQITADILISEPAALAGTASFTLKTSYSHRYYWGLPISDFSKINFDNVNKQVLTVTAIAAGFLSEDDWPLGWSTASPTRFAVRVGDIEGMILLKGEVAFLNTSLGWYSPLGEAIVRLYPTTMIPDYMYPFSIYVIITDENGRFNASIGARGSAPAWHFDAWKIDWQTGDFEYATDRGPLYGQGVTKAEAYPLAPVEEILIPTIKAKSITIYELLAPGNVRRPAKPDPRVPSTNSWLLEGVALEVYDYYTRGVPFFYGYTYSPTEYPALIFAEEKARLIINLRVKADWPQIVLVNASESNTEGYGWYLNKHLYIKNSILVMAKDLLYLVKGRYTKLKERNVRSLSVENALQVAEKLVSESEEAFKNKKYSEGYNKALAALVYLSKAYRTEVMPLYDDTGKTSIILFIVIIPSIIFLERLLFHEEEGKRRIIWLVIVGVVLMAIFYFIHPAFSLMTNSFMSFMGILLILLFSIAIVVLGSETKAIIEKTAERLMGKHRVERETVSAILMSIPMALENMRRRPLRTILTLLTIITIVIALTSLTSVSYYMDIKFSPAGYKGKDFKELLIKRGYAIPPYGPLDDNIVNYIKAFVGDKGLIAPRSWYYPVYGQRIGYRTLVYSEKGSFSVTAFLGITGAEIKRVYKQAFMEELSDEDLEFIAELFDSHIDVCLIPDIMAEKLKVKEGDLIEVIGKKYRIVGILSNASLYSIRDPDGMLPTPVRPEDSAQLSIEPPGAPSARPSSVAWSDVIIVPYRNVLDMGGYVSAISVLFDEDVSIDEMYEIAKKIAYGTDVQVYVSIPGREAEVGARVPTFMFLGWETIPFVILLSALNITVTLLGNLKERMKDLYVFTAVGLSPMGSALMFITETLSYAAIASTIGYILGFLLNNAFISFGVLPSNFVFNFASFFVGTAFLIVILACLGSAAYPSYIAAKLITPSLERRWKPPTKPKGDIWELPIPARLPSREEAEGLLEFLYEYYTGMGKEKRYFIVREVSEPDLDNLVLKLTVALAPFELNVLQEVQVYVIADEIRKMYSINLRLKRLGGLHSVWYANNYYFIDDLRKQLLLWRSLTIKDHVKYYEVARKRKAS